MRMDLADKQNYQPIGSPFVGEIDHNEITYLEVCIKCLLQVLYLLNLNIFAIYSKYILTKII